MRKQAWLALASVFGLAAFPGIFAYADKKSAAQTRQFFRQIPKDQRIEQALNRLTFGPRPGDAAQVRTLGLKKWIDLQLHPERIPQNPVLAEKLKTLDTLTMSSEELVRNYPTPQMVKQMASGQMPFPSDPERRMMIQKLVAKAERKQGDTDPAANAPNTKKLDEIFTPQQLRTLRTGTPPQRLAVFQSLTKDQQDEAIEAMPPPLRQYLMQVAPAEMRRRLELTAGPQQMVARDLMEAKLLRAIYGSRQLEEVLDDFWFNHFNIFLDKGADRYLVTEYEHAVIRPRVLG